MMRWVNVIKCYGGSPYGVGYAKPAPFETSAYLEPPSPIKNPRVRTRPRPGAASRAYRLPVGPHAARVGGASVAVVANDGGGACCLLACGALKSKSSPAAWQIASQDVRGGKTSLTGCARKSAHNYLNLPWRGPVRDVSRTNERVRTKHRRI
jgi:hypothetical protein